tara:strand:- start:1265 stop:2476 length:1212 start_codon:yes stop_codon:yes gene_type:complete
MQEFDNLLKKMSDIKDLDTKYRWESLELIKKLNAPSKKDEYWRLTNLRKLASIFNKPISNKFKDININEDKLDNIKISINQNKILIDNQPKDNVLEILSREEINDFLNKKYNNTQSLKFNNLLNNVLADRTIGLRALNNSNLSLEIIIPSIENALCANKLIIILEENTNIKIIENIQGANNSALSHSTYIVSKESSNINHGIILSGDNSSSILGTFDIEQDKNTSYKLTTISYGWSFSRLDQNIKQKDGQSETIIKGLQKSDDDQQLSTYSNIYFNGPGGKFDQINKSTANGKSHAIFEGSIVVPQIAQQTDASQLSRNLILAERARIDTKPQLEIVADDVSCKHGATISKLQEEEIFYMQTRGLSLEEAKQLQIKSFYQDIIDNLPDNSSSSHILDSLMQSN